MYVSKKHVTYSVVLLIFAVIFVPEYVGAQIADNLKCKGCVGTKDLGKKSVTRAKVKKNAVRKKHIKDAQITSAKIADGAVEPADLSSAAKPAAAGFSSANGVNVGAVSEPLAGTDTVVASVTIDLPGPGTVIVNSGGHLAVLPPAGGVGGAVCSITKGQTATEALLHTQAEYVAGASRTSIGTTRGFAETAAGSQTYNLVCHGENNVLLRDVILTAFFAPQG